MTSTNHGSGTQTPSENGTTLVDFDDDFLHPHQWPQLRKWLAMFAVGIPLLLMPLSSTIISPGLGAITKEFGSASEIAGPLLVSVFLLMYCIGPLLLGPLSEVLGRRPVLQAGSVIYLCFNISGGFSQSWAQLLIFRLLSGFGAGASLAVGSSMVADCFSQEKRGRALALISLGPVMGSCLGPIAGGFLTQYASWRWCFHSTSIAAAVYLVFSVIISRETYPPVLLKHRKARIVKEMGNTEKSRLLKTPYEDSSETVAQLYKRSLSRPIYLLATQPIVQVLALYYGFLYGLIYLLLSTFSELWTESYNLSISIGSLQYVAPCIGYTAGSIFCATCTNWAFRYFRDRNGGVKKPELRLPLMVPFSILVPLGLFLYGWSAEYKLHWIVPDIGVALPLLGSTVIFQCTSAYLLDTFTIYAASANGAVYLLRGLAAFGFPLFSPPMYSALGYGWGNSVLAFFAVVFGIPIPIVLLKYGEKLRAASSFARHRVEMEN